jgi:hypothetical protein
MNNTLKQKSSNLNNYLEESKSNFLVIILLIFTIFYLSHLSYSIGFAFSTTTPLLLLIYLYFIIKKNRKIIPWVFFLSIFILVTSLLVVFFHFDYKLIFFPGNIVIGLLLSSILSKNEFISIVKIGSIIILMLLIGSIIAFIIVLYDPKPYLNYITPGLRVIGFYYTSLGTPIWTPYGTIIRGNAIYDEPGTFSFLICSFVLFRDFFKLSKRFSFILLLLGLVTFSLAHYIFLSLFLLREIKIKNIKWILFTLIIVFIFSINNTLITRLFEYSFSERLFSNTNSLSEGNNRMPHILKDINTIESGDFYNLFLGNNHENCCSPLYPFAQFGFYGGWPYYVFLILLLFFSIFNKNILILGSTFLWLQRPSLTSSGYSFIGTMIIIIIINDFLIRIRDSKEIITL